MVTTGSEYFYRISGLSVPSGEAPDTLEHDINKYIDLIEKLTEAMKQNLREGQTPMLVRNILMVKAMLTNVYAKWLEPEAKELLEEAKDGTLDNCRKTMPGFVTNLMSLSIEMQKAQNEKDARPVPVASQPVFPEVEQHTDLMRDITAISRFIAAGDYGRAQELITAIEKAGHPREIQDLIAAGRYEDAVKLAGEHLDNLGGDRGDGIKMVLAVDDKPEILTGIQLALKGHYKVIGMTGGLEAIRFIQKHLPNLFILDIEMPEVDGFQVAEVIRENPELEHSPIIFLTGNSSREYVLRARALNVKDFMVKPADATSLLATVGKYLG